MVKLNYMQKKGKKIVSVAIKRDSSYVCNSHAAFKL